MADVHECEQCGQHCDCDGEDTYNAQTDDCVHLTDDEECPVDSSSDIEVDNGDAIEIADSIRRGARL